MGRILDFTLKFAPKILSVKPYYSSEGGFGWSIINSNAENFGGVENVPVIHRSGTIKPFCNNGSLKNLFTLTQNCVDIWRNDSGYSREPLFLVVETQENNLNKSGTNSDSIPAIAGMLMGTLKPKHILIPSSKEWLGLKQSSQLEEEVLSINDHHSERALKRDFSQASTFDRHRIVQAIGLGIYAGEVNIGKRNLPRLNYCA